MKETLSPNGVRAANPEKSPRFLTGSAVMERAAGALERAAATDVRVVLYGEPGVGKTFVASILHRLSDRCDGSLVRLSLRDGGAAARLTSAEFRCSLHGGTLVLEGAHEAAPATQAALVGALEEWAAAEQDTVAPVRVVATSECDLADAVANGGFRADLFYLLEVLPICLPPLRERAEEIPLLVAEFARRRGVSVTALPELPEGFLEQAVAYPWPGNLRELESVVARALPQGAAEPWQFPTLLHPRGGRGCVPSFQVAKREFESSYVRRLLLVTEGNVTRAAELAGKARKDFYALMARNRVDPGRFRPEPLD